MADIIHLEEYPAQFLGIRFGDDQLFFLFQYNLTFDFWSFSIFDSDAEDACPLVAGREVVSGRNLVEGILPEYILAVVDRPGIALSNINNYYRFTQILDGSKYPLSYLMRLTVAERDEILAESVHVFPAC